jgi:hypothetical protein
VQVPPTEGPLTWEFLQNFTVLHASEFRLANAPWDLTSGWDQTVFGRIVTTNARPHDRVWWPPAYLRVDWSATAG